MSQELNDFSVNDASAKTPESGNQKKVRDRGVKVRLKFRKFGRIKFIGHLDIMRFFQKLIRRAGLDIAYSEGFHPHQIMSFANPLGVGLLSEGEYVDITLNTASSSDDIVNALNAQSVPGLEIVSARRLPENAENGMASVARADYMVEIIKPICGLDEEASLSSIVSAFYAQDECLVEKKTKKGSKLIDLKKSVHELYCDKENRICMRVNAGSAENIRPELVVNAIVETAGGRLEDFSLLITRLEQYDSSGRTLEAVGEEF